MLKKRSRMNFNNQSQILATKQDIAEVREYVANTKADIIKWMFIFWIGQVIATFGFILLFLKK